MSVQTRCELDGQREVRRDRVERFGHEDLASERLDGDVDARQLRDLARPRSCRIDDHRRRDVIVAGADATDLTTRAADLGDLHVLDERRTVLSPAAAVAAEQARWIRVA